MIDITKRCIALLLLPSLILMACTNTYNAPKRQQCTTSQNYSLEIADNSKQLMVCGHKNEEDSLLTEITVFDILHDSVVFDTEGDAISRYSIGNTDSGLAIVNYRFMLIGDKFEEMTTIPSEILLFYANNHQKLTFTSYNIFSYPRLTAPQIDSINKVCDVIVNTIAAQPTTQKHHYPLPYETMYLLYIGAFHNMDNAYDIWTNLSEHFEFDGAEAETLSELGAGNM